MGKTRVGGSDYRPHIYRAPHQAIDESAVPTPIDTLDGDDIGRTENVLVSRVGEAGGLNQLIADLPDEEREGLRDYLQECAAEAVSTTVELRAA